MIRSMTGFGRGKAYIDSKEFLVELKTVNHRYLDVSIKMLKQLSFIEDKVRGIISKNISRGKLDIYISFNDYTESAKNISVDIPLVKAYNEAINTICDCLGTGNDVRTSTILELPDVLKVEKKEYTEDEIWYILEPTLKNAISSLISMREIEGVELKASLLEKLVYVEKLLEEIKELATSVISDYRIKLQNRIKEIFDQLVVDENRLELEVALLADRCSIDEEIVRLASHINQFRGTIEIDQPIGRKLDFLVQEMNREINTIGSKANNLLITRNVVELKSELEKIREQVQNIE